MPQNATIRNFAWPDLTAWTKLVNELADESGTATGGDAEVDAGFKRRFLSQPSVVPDENCFIAEVEDEAAGMARVSPEPLIGRAVAEVAVLSRHRRRGVGRQLLEAAIERVRGLDVEVLHVQVPVLSRGGRFLLEDAGFFAARRYWRLSIELEGFKTPSVPAGFSIRHFELERDEQTLADLQNAAFEGGWGFSPNTVEDIAAGVRLRPWEPDGVLLLQSSDGVCGYNWTHRPKERGARIGTIGMTGIHPDFRGRGLGRFIVSAGMAYLSDQGACTVTLEVDHSNKPARELYLSMGFGLSEETVWYELNRASFPPLPLLLPLQRALKKRATSPLRAGPTRSPAERSPRRTRSSSPPRP